MNTPKTPGQINFEGYCAERYAQGDGHCQKWAEYEKKERWEAAAAAVIAHHEAQKQSEPEPEPKFKVGDRIRRVDCFTHWAPAGFESVVLPNNACTDKQGDTVSIVPEWWKKVEWTLPSPPPGHSWNHADWTEDMLTDGWRPLLMGELIGHGDEAFFDSSAWEVSSNAGHPASPNLRYRTRRLLPPPDHTVTFTLPPLNLQTGKLSLASQ